MIEIDRRRKRKKRCKNVMMYNVPVNEEENKR